MATITVGAFHHVSSGSVINRLFVERPGTNSQSVLFEATAILNDDLEGTGDRRNHLRKGRNKVVEEETLACFHYVRSQLIGYAGLRGLLECLQ